MSDGAAGTPRRILVVANETVAGKPLIDAIKRRTSEGAASVYVVCPQNQPRHGSLIYDTEVRAAAENRLKMTLALLHEEGIDAEGAVMDPDPYAAATDALGERQFDEIIVSTHPETRSGWLRQGLPDRLARDTGLPVEHVVVDVDAEDDDRKHTLVVANQTVGGDELIELLKSKAGEEPRRFIVICPQSGGEAEDGQAHERLAHTLHELEEAGLDAIGQIVHPDPYTAIQNALRAYGADEVVISTFPETRSGWLRNDLVERVRSSTNKPVEHVVSEG
jgi:DNA-binding LacI/PurR family transcriptional regulator